MSKTIPAIEYCSAIFDGTHDTPKQSENGHPLVTSKHMNGDNLNLSEAYLISSEDFENINKRSKVSQWDILFSMIGTVGEVYLERSKNINYAIKNIGVFSCGDEKRAEWLFYYLKSPAAKKYIQSYLSGAVQKFLSLGALRKFPLLPFDEVASRVIGIVATVDKKIELNKRINSELEAIARTLYDYWFVQFDFPDANGNPYKTSGGKMVYNPTLKREIPDGWDVRSISDISDVKAGGDKPSDFSEVKTENHQVPIFSNGVSDDGLYGFTKKATIERKSITISARGTIGYSVLRMKPFVPIIRLLVLTPRDTIDLKFVDETIKRMGFENSGSVQQQLTVPQISKVNIVYPPQETRELYANAVKGSVKKIELLKDQNQELKVLRDWLLPMIMSGQVTVK